VTHSRPVLALSEWQTGHLPGVTVSAGDRRLVEQLGSEQGRLAIDELRTGIRVKAFSWVGLVRFTNFEVRIEPKLAGDNLHLVEMLAFASGLDALRRNIGTRLLAPAPGGTLLDLFALLLAEGCERIAAGGLLHGYVEYENDLPVLRGRLLTDKQIRVRRGQFDRLECRYDEHSSDILENQILLAALSVCNRRVSHPLARLCTRRMLALYSGACSLLSFDPRSGRELMRNNYNRLNQHYQEAHELAWLLMEGLGIQDLLASESTRCFAFLLDMNRLFELFVLRLVRHILWGRPYHVRYQHKTNSIIWDITHRRPYSRVVPDLILETVPPGPQRLVVDAKYKTYDEKRLGSSDIYQSFLYAYAYSSPLTATPEAMLLYPASLQGATPIQLQIRSLAQHVGAQIQAVGIRIPQALQEVRIGIAGPTTKLLLEMVEKTLPANG
jgi:5-methylcytosine-specific restriction enzyme subunit McrC